MNTEESNGVFGLTTQGIGLLVTASKQSLDEQPMLPEAQYFYLIYPNTVGDSLVARVATQFLKVYLFYLENSNERRLFSSA